MTEIIIYPKEFCPHALRMWRIRRGYSQEHIAKALKLTKYAVYLYEKGTRNPKPESVAKMAAILRISEEALYARP